MKALGDFLRPEFLARVDEIVVFRNLDVQDFEKIAALLLDEYKAPLLEKGVRFDYDPAVAALVAREAFGQKSGARDIRRIVRREVEDVISLLLVEAGEQPPALMKAVVQEGKVSILCG